MIIVSDSGPLAYLVQIGVADRLPILYGDVYIPPTDEALRESVRGHSKQPAFGEYAYVWFMAWAGTVFAGGLFGMIAGGGIGLLVGPVFAGFFGVPVTVSFAIITWAFWLTRFTVLMSALAGGCTGFIATAVTWDSIFETDFPTSLLLASLIGALGSGGATRLYWTKHGRRRAAAVGVIASTWHYSLRDLFFHFTVVAALIACWAIAVKAYFTASSAVERTGQLNNSSVLETEAQQWQQRFRLTRASL